MANLPQPVVNIADLPLETWSQGSHFGSAGASFGARLGLNGLGISYDEVPPGKSSCPFHNHHVEDELFIVLAGEGTYRFGADRHAIKAGDVLGAPAGGPETAHHIVNTGAAVLRYLSISTMAATEVVEYPDSGKFLISSRPAGRENGKLRYIARDRSGLDYWDGEANAKDSK
ncbi:MAG: cupin domain-containing protein [Cucumibacter sp.]